MGASGEAWNTARSSTIVSDTVASSSSSVLIRSLRSRPLRVGVVGLVVGLLGALDDLLGARRAQSCEQIVDGAGRTVDRFRVVVVVGTEQGNDRRGLARVLELVVSVHLVGVTHQQHGVVGLFDGCDRLLGLDLLLGLVASR